MFKLSFFLLFFIYITSNDYSVEIDGTIGQERFIMISENTVANDASAVDTSGSTEYLIGSVEINLYNNSLSGTDRVYMQNLEYDEALSIFCAKNSSYKEQIRIVVKIDRDTNGNIFTSGSQNLTAASEVLIRSTSANIVNERTILSFYAKDDPNNDPGSTGAYLAHFQFTWEDV